ncbi:MAG: manganese efflux pump, partial [Bacteroidales bacterium]|nr:manganese efflux pump [Bacteroidales bacterium]
MSYIEIFLLAIGLCFDTIAISLVGGAGMCRISAGKYLKIIFSFGLVQGLFTVIGWALGTSFLKYIESFDHWIAFGLLLFIGGKMVIETFGEEKEECVDLLSTGKLILASIATSIDALAVGVSFAMLSFSNTKVLITFFIITFVTAATSALGLSGGKWVGKLVG